MYIMKTQEKEVQNTDVIIRHINKLQGQLESVKKELLSADPRCDVASTTLYAAARSFASLRTLFITCFLYRAFEVRDKNTENTEKLLKLIQG